jgi:hypothetical protein
MVAGHDECMSPKGRPEGEYRSAQHEGTPVSAPGRPKRELLRPPRGHAHITRFEVSRHPRSQTCPTGLGFALLARASP